MIWSRGTHRVCLQCGKEFDVDGSKYQGARMYCSYDCFNAHRKAAEKETRKMYYLRHRQRKPDREIICKRCGETFKGRGKQLYCQKCLNSGDSYMSKLRGQRSAV